MKEKDEKELLLRRFNQFKEEYKINQCIYYNTKPRGELIVDIEEYNLIAIKEKEHEFVFCKNDKFIILNTDDLREADAITRNTNKDTVLKQIRMKLEMKIETIIEFSPVQLKYKIKK